MSYNRGGHKVAPHPRCHSTPFPCLTGCCSCLALPACAAAPSGMGSSALPSSPCLLSGRRCLLLPDPSAALPSAPCPVRPLAGTREPSCASYGLTNPAPPLPRPPQAARGREQLRTLQPRDTGLSKASQWHEPAAAAPTPSVRAATLAAPGKGRAALTSPSNPEGGTRGDGWD